MGERGAPPAMWARVPAWGSGDSLLVVLLVALLVAALGWRPGAFRPLEGAEATVLLEASSRAFEGDATVGPSDRQRSAELWPAAEGAFAPSHTDESSPSGTDATIYAWLLAAVFHLLPGSAVAVLNTLLLSLAALLAARVLRRSLGDLAGWWIALCVGGTTAFAHVFRVQPELLSLALVAVGLALAFTGSQPEGGRLDEIFDGGHEGSSSRVLGRWAASGASLGLAAAISPATLPLLFAAAFVPRADRRRAAAAALLVGGSLGLAAGLLVGGNPLAAFGRGPMAFDDVGLWRANLLYLVAGGRGLLALFPALLLLPWTVGGGSGRRAVSVAVALSVLAVIGSSPHSWALGLGQPLLPLWSAVWFLAARPFRAGLLLLPVVLAAPLLLPLWLAPRSSGGAVPSWLQPVTRVARALLYETTQRPEGDEKEMLWHGLSVRTLSPALWPTAGGSLRWLGGEPASLLLASARRPLRLSLRFGEDASSELSVRGATLDSTLLAPDGGVEFRLLLEQPTASHRGYDGPRQQHFVRLDLAMPGAPMRPLDVVLEAEVE